MLFRFKVPADGDCALTSIAHFLVLHKEALQVSFSSESEISKILFQETVDMQQLVNALRALAVARVRADEDLQEQLKSNFSTAFAQYCADRLDIEFASNTRDDIFCDVDAIGKAFREELYAKYQKKLASALSTDRTFDHLSSIVAPGKDEQLLIFDEELSEDIGEDLTQLWHSEENGWNAFLQHIGRPKYSLGDIEISALGRALGFNVEVHELPTTQQDIPDAKQGRLLFDETVGLTVSLIHSNNPAHWDLAVSEAEFKKLNGFGKKPVLKKIQQEVVVEAFDDISDDVAFSPVSPVAGSGSAAGSNSSSDTEDTGSSDDESIALTSATVASTTNIDEEEPPVVPVGTARNVVATTDSSSTNKMFDGFGSEQLKNTDASCVNEKLFNNKEELLNNKSFKQINHDIGEILDAIEVKRNILSKEEVEENIDGQLKDDVSKVADILFSIEKNYKSWSRKPGNENKAESAFFEAHCKEKTAYIEPVSGLLNQLHQFILSPKNIR